MYASFRSNDKLNERQINQQANNSFNSISFKSTLVYHSIEDIKQTVYM